MFKTQENTILLSLLAVILLLAIAACGGPVAQPQPTIESPPTDIPAPAAVEPTATEEPVSGRDAGDILRLLYWQAPTIVNPHLSPGTKDLSASTNHNLRDIK